jgi:hypothetical protein
MTSPTLFVIAACPQSFLFSEGFPASGNDIRYSYTFMNTLGNYNS